MAEKKKEAPVGVEPTRGGFAIRCLSHLATEPSVPDSDYRRSGRFSELFTVGQDESKMRRLTCRPGLRSIAWQGSRFAQQNPMDVARQSGSMRILACDYSALKLPGPLLPALPPGGGVGCPRPGWPGNPGWPGGPPGGGPPGPPNPGGPNPPADL